MAAFCYYRDWENAVTFANGHLDLPRILRCEASEVIEKLETKNQEKRSLEVSK